MCERGLESDREKCDKLKNERVVQVRMSIMSVRDERAEGQC